MWGSLSHAVGACASQVLPDRNTWRARGSQVAGALLSPSIDAAILHRPVPASVVRELKQAEVRHQRQNGTRLHRTTSAHPLFCSQCVSWKRAQLRGRYVHTHCRPIEVFLGEERSDALCGLSGRGFIVHHLSPCVEARATPKYRCSNDRDSRTRIECQSEPFVTAVGNRVDCVQGRGGVLSTRGATATFIGPRGPAKVNRQRLLQKDH